MLVSKNTYPSSFILTRWSSDIHVGWYANTQFTAGIRLEFLALLKTFWSVIWADCKNKLNYHVVGQHWLLSQSADSSMCWTYSCVHLLFMISCVHMFVSQLMSQTNFVISFQSAALAHILVFKCHNTYRSKNPVHQVFASITNSWVRSLTRR